MRALLSCMFLVLSAPVGAQPGDATVSEILWSGPTELQLTTRFVGPRGTVELSSSRNRVRLHQGNDQGMAVAAGNDDGVLVAMLRGDEVHVSFVPIDEGRVGRARHREVARLAGNERVPVGVSIAVRPDGFAVFWQESHATNPGAAYQTFIARFDDAGQSTGPAAEVPAVWPLASAVWLPERGQYYFLLFYGTGDPRGTRLCGVHIDGATLRPVEHPWWASDPGFITEGRVVTHGGRVVAVYRGGPEGDRLLEVDVTAGAWGRWAGETRDHGPIAESGWYGVRMQGPQVEIETSRALP